jgi:serine/threonine protein kinase
MSGLEGITLDHYHIQRCLGHGGMADVYLAHDSTTGQDVAVKVLTGNHATYLERFRREAEAIDKLQHKHILPAFDYGDAEPWHYLVMPYIAHGTLLELLDENPLPLHKAADLFDQIASALQFAHDHGIIHRDIKPSNILLKDNSYIYLADFGLAKAVEGTNELTQTGILLGTPEYMAPDLADGPATTSSDIYALGILLYQMVTGQVPFSADTPIAVYWKQIREQPLPPSQVNPGLSSAIDRVILRTLDKDPRRRYQSALELAKAFRAALSAPAVLPSTDTFLSNRNKYVSITPLPLRPLKAEIREPINMFTDAEAALLPAPVGPRKLNKLATSIVSIGLVLFIVLPMTFLFYIYRTHSGTPTTTSTVLVNPASNGALTSQSKLTPQSAPHDPVSQAIAVQNTVLHSQPVLIDNLTGNTLNRWTVDGSRCMFGYAGYIVTAMQVTYQQACPMLSPTVGNTAVETDVTMLGGTSAGMLFRMNGSQSYDFEITNTNEFFFARHDASSASGTSTSYLIKNTYNSVILAMGQKNTLLIIADGADFKLYINGSFVGEVQDSTYTHGQLALTSGTSGLVTAGQANFSNLKVFDL